MDYRSLFDYCEESGLITWKIKPSKKIEIGEKAGFPVAVGRDKKIYTFICYKQKMLRAHHVAFALMGVEIMPGDVVDHINGDGEDNSWRNLRLVSQTENNKNKRLGQNNKVGIYNRHKQDEYIFRAF